MSQLILTDIDETVLDFTTPFEAWLRSKDWTLYGRMRDIYDLPRLLHTDVDTAVSLVREFHETSPAMRTLEPEPCAKEVLPRLHTQGYRFVAITACVDTPVVRQKRLDNLERAFGFSFEDCHCVGLRQPKDAVLQRYEPTTWVEDNFDHAVAGAAFGHRSFVITRGHNAGREDERVARVSGWLDIEKLL